VLRTRDQGHYRVRRISHILIVMGNFLLDRWIYLIKDFSSKAERSSRSRYKEAVRKTRRIGRAEK
jgi:hypothetical protein